MGSDCQYTIEDLLAIMARLRGPGGCPWDQQQTHSSIKNHLIEECYELIEAIDQLDYDGIKEEAGDILLHVIFHAQMASEQKKFDFSDIIQKLVEKLIRRHPHVFGEHRLDCPEQVLAQWQEIKKTEKPERLSPLDAIPKGLPQIQRALKLQKIAADNHLDWEAPQQILEKLTEEIQELNKALNDPSSSSILEELGDLFFTLINLSRHLNVTPEDALKQANQKFQNRLAHFLKIACDHQLPLNKLSTAEIDSLWQQAKGHFAGAGGSGASTTG
jgi:tetrapyrrole methylase family protein/MazG family protein